MGVDVVESELVVDTDKLAGILVCLEVSVKRVAVILFSVEELSPRPKWSG